MTSIQKQPYFDQIDRYQTRYVHKREAFFEKDLRTLTDQLFKKLNQPTKMLKNIKQVSKKNGKNELLLTKWWINIFSPLYPYPDETQRWMLFRASVDLWKVLENIYGKKRFHFRIKENTNTSSQIKYQLYLNWNQNRSRPSISDQFKLVKRPNYLENDPRKKILHNHHLKKLQKKQNNGSKKEFKKLYEFIPERHYNNNNNNNTLSSDETSELGISSCEYGKISVSSVSSVSSGSDQSSSYLDRGSY